MMEFSTEIVLRLLLAANVVLLGAVAIALLRFREQAERFENFWDSPAGVSLADAQSLEAESRARPTRPADANLERKLDELSGVVRALAQRDQAACDTADNQLPIENAVRMAKHGASTEELVRSCGLNIGEAQLMRKLHATAGGTTHSETRP